MTQQYMAGELSALLAEWQAIVGDTAVAQTVVRLRREAETLPVAALTTVVIRALDHVDRACWQALADGDAAAFDRQAAVSAHLYAFGASAGLLADH